MDTVAIKTSPPHAPLSSSLQKHLKHNNSSSITSSSATSTTNNSSSSSSNSNSNNGCTNNSASGGNNATSNSTSSNDLLYTKSSIGAFFQTCKTFWLNSIECVINKYFTTPLDRFMAIEITRHE
uniref:Uncharacterized protein n=1 Tax=Glossina austeni TaxID=7395 RepID=A0A1A9VWG4_GLOAU